VYNMMILDIDGLLYNTPFVYIDPCSWKGMIYTCVTLNWTFLNHIVVVFRCVLNLILC
jgi:hypothetical protein